jgi:hypothetical protein
MSLSTVTINRTTVRENRKEKLDRQCSRRKKIRITCYSCVDEIEFLWRKTTIGFIGFSRRTLTHRSCVCLLLFSYEQILRNDNDNACKCSSHLRSSYTFVICLLLLFVSSACVCSALSKSNRSIIRSMSIQ